MAMFSVALVSIRNVLDRLLSARRCKSEGGQGRGRTADLPLFRWKQVLVSMQVEGV